MAWDCREEDDTLSVEEERGTMTRTYVLIITKNTREEEMEPSIKCVPNEVLLLVRLYKFVRTYLFVSFPFYDL